MKNIRSRIALSLLLSLGFLGLAGEAKPVSANSLETPYTPFVTAHEYRRNPLTEQYACFNVDGAVPKDTTSPFGPLYEGKCPPRNVYPDGRHGMK